MKLNYVKHKLANLISINKIVTIHQYEFGKDFHFEGESHNFWEMVYADKGRVRIKAGTREFFLESGEVCFHKPNEFHSISGDNITSSEVFVISFVCSSSAIDFFKNKHTRVPTALKKHISLIMEESKRTFELMPVTGISLNIKEDALPGGQQLIRIHLEEFLILLMRAESEEKNTRLFPTKESMENHIVAEMISVIEDNIYNRISVSDICERLNYSRAYLSKIFKNTTSYTILEYINNLKIKEAKRLIRENLYNFTQISDKLMFDNPHYFSRVFKRVTGHTPGEYKNSVL